MIGPRKLSVLGAWLAVGVLAAWAAEPLNPPPPLAAAIPAVAPISSGNAAATLVGAERAQELGLPDLAAALYQELLAAPGADRAGLTLPLATALLDAGRAIEAEQVLGALASPRGPEWRLRMGLAAAAQKKFDDARGQVNTINVDELTRPDRAWFWFLQGVLHDAAIPRDTKKANDFYRLAEQEAPTPLAKARFLIAGERARLRLVNYTTADLEAARRGYEQYQDSSTGYQFAADYAVYRDALGGTTEAVRFLSELLVRLPRAERAWTDQFRLLLGFIGDRGGGGAGRNALNQLLETGSNPDWQREALQLLARDSTRDPERSQFRAELDKLIGLTPKPAILDSVLLMRAELALRDTPKDYATAERRANELKNDLPGSPLRPHALIVLTTLAWEQQRYRVAADNARQARDALAASPAASSPTEAKIVAETQAELGVLEAEARYRAGDFRLAADAYAAALRDPPARIPVGELMFQRALAEIRAGAEDAAKVVDELAANPQFDPKNRWEAEWSLARALKTQNRTEEALGRVTQLLATMDPAKVPADLRARMTWLQARLAFDAGHPEQALTLASKLGSPQPDIPPALATEIASSGALLKAEAEFALGREAAALETLKNLRSTLPESKDAVYSFLVQAEHEAGHDQIQKAQTTLQTLIDSPAYQNSEYIPYALFQLAALSERLGQEKDLKAAVQLIEDLVSEKRTPPTPAGLVFAARLKQGDLFRQLNDFPSAQRAYEELVNKPRFANRPDVVVAQLRLAECHNAQSSTDPSGSHADLAQSLFEELLYRLAAPDDVRVEAGYNLGKMFERRRQPDRARDVWWRDVITPFLLGAKEPIPATAKRPFWLARTLLDLGTLFEQQEKLDEAKRVYVLLRDAKLGWDGPARERLQRLGVADVPPTKL